MDIKIIAKKILLFPVTKIVIGSIAVLGIYLISQYWLEKLFNLTSFSEEVNNLCVKIIASMFAIAVYILLFRLYEKRKISELSIHRFLKNVLLGAVIGTLLQSLTILVIYLNGGYKVISVNSFLFIIPGLAMGFSSAIFEEILIRGVIFRIIEEKLGSYLALFLSAIVFGFMHLSNPNSSVVMALGLAVQAGLLLASAYIYSRNLWFPIAMHFAWNFTQTGIYGARVSGITIEKTLFTSKIEGAEWFTGGQFGPEGSIQATVFCLTATVILLILAAKQNKIIQPYWKNKNQQPLNIVPINEIG